MIAPARAGKVDRIQSRQRRFGMKNVSAVQKTCATNATAACGVAMSVVLVVENPYPAIMRGLNYIVLVCNLKWQGV